MVIRLVIEGPINVHLDPLLVKRLDEIHIKVDNVLSQGAKLMADITLAKEALTALNNTTNQLASAVNDVIAADQAEDDAFRAEIQRLKDQIAAGGAVSQADLDELTAGMGATKATLEAVSAALSSMGSSPTQPIPPVDIPPVEPPPPTDEV